MSAVLLVGSGAREHAMAWKLARSPHVERLILVPGNDAMARARVTAGRALKVEAWPAVGGEADLPARRAAFVALAARAKEEGVSLAVIGPDNPLADGIVDAFDAAGVPAFGPTAAAARIEASKAFAKEVMTAAQVPTAKYKAVESVEEARAFLAEMPWEPPHSGWVVKADGLALGKGVQVCATRAEAEAAVDRLMPVSGRLVIEERVRGREVSWMAFCDGARVALMDPARDYKRLLDNDQGPNTGGMGAYSPVADVATTQWERLARERVFRPVVEEMARRGCPFRGVLYAGLMIGAGGSPADPRFWVLEFNARFGDPEAQVLLPRMDGDLYEWCLACAKGDLSQLPPRVPFLETPAVYVTAAAPGYPDSPKAGDTVEGPFAQGELDARQPEYFCAGVRRHGEHWVTHGGRVLGALGVGANLEAARKRAYDRLAKVKFAGMQFRKDVGVEIGR